MKIAFFIRSVTNGGAERVAAALSMIWSELGHEVVLITQMSQSDDEFEHKCVEREVFDTRHVTRKRIQQLYAKHNFEVAVFNDALDSEWFDTVFGLIRELKSVKLLIMSHHPFTNWMYTLSCTCDFLKVQLFSQADAFVSVDVIHALWWRHRGCKSLYIPNPFAVKFEGCVRYRPSHDIIWMGRVLDRCKQFPLALKVFCRVAMADETATFKILGAISEKEKRKFFDRLPKAIRERVTFLGFVAQPGKIISGAGLYMFTSNSEATIPQVIFETLSCGVPVVAWDIPDLSELTEADGVVKIRECGEMDSEMSESIIKLLNDPERLKALSQSAVKYIENRRHSSSTVKLWKGLFDSLAAGDVNTFIEKHASMFVNGATYQRMCDELQHAGVNFIKRFLPELISYRILRQRLDPRYIVKRMLYKLKSVV